MQYMNQGPMFLSVQMHQPDRTAHAYMDALQAFWPGLQVRFLLCSLRLDFVFKLHVKTVVVCKGKEGFSYSISFF